MHAITRKKDHISDLDKIWCAEAEVNCSDNYLTKNHGPKFTKADGCHIGEYR